MSQEAETIARLEKERCAALVAADKEALNRLLSDSLVVFHTDGRKDDKARYIGNLGGGFRYSVMNALDQTIAIHDGAAIVSGSMHVEVVTAKQETAALDTRITCVWAKEAGAWRLTHYQATRIAS
ncbi:MAG: nuclear transport factor 2 family protein [Hyphomonadaceae bacterium]